MKQHMGWSVWIVMVGLWCGAALAHAEDATPVSQEASVEDAAAVAVQGVDNGASALTATPAAGGVISVDFKDADIRQVLRIISLKSGVDIVAGTGVEGLVTIKLTSVPWEEALDIILRTYGFTYERKGNIVRVMTLDALEQEALSTAVFPLDYAEAKAVPDVVKEMLSDRGKVQFDERTNTVIVTDIPSNLFQIEKVIKRLDQRTPQVVISTKIVETRLNKNESLGIEWSESATMTQTSATMPTTYPFPRGNALDDVWDKFISIPTLTSPAGGEILGNSKVPTTGGTFTFGTLSSSSLTSTINFLKSRTDTHIVSNPNIAVLNNQEAKIHIGEEYPIPNYTIDPTTGRTTISGYTAKNIGTVLAVTPHVNPSNEIVTDLKPEVITAADEVSFSTGSDSSIELPRFTVQTAQTQVRIRSGETIAIGGLVKKADVKIVKKVPFLGDIPIIGLLFTNTDRYTAAGSADPVHQDLVIFLTVQLQDERPVEQVAVGQPEAMGVAQ